MKVEFTCEECGRERSLCTNPSDAQLLNMAAGARTVCTRCNPPEPSYGPITEEMVAEMLCVALTRMPGAADGAGEDEDYRRQARAVIRLLEFTAMYDPFSDPLASSLDWHAKLLELAKP